MPVQTFVRAGLVALAASALGTTNADIIAFDLVNSGSQNLTEYNNPWTDAFGSAGDGFQIYQRGVSASIPFAVVDDSNGSFPPDTQGIIGADDMDTFFGVVDTVNSDNNAPVTAEWVFDINGAGNLSMSIDMAAMGDFENSDFFSWSYSIDGGAEIMLFEGITDEALSQDYTLEDGDTFTLNDPLTVEGLSLSNAFLNFSGLIDGTGSSLSIFLTASANGGSEAFAFRNLIINGDVMSVSEPSILLLMGLGLGLIGTTRRR
ncbi:MAG: PEP-CTERM sorting domain-containing protein [Pseudomonadota bacterium]